MKKILTFILVVATNITVATANDSIAHDSVASHDALQLKIVEAMKENVEVHQSPQISRLMQDRIDDVKREQVQIQGYRVQVFSSNKHATAKTEAFEVEKKLNSHNLDTEIYVLYNPPFWKVRTGDFRTQQEAIILRDELIERFPEWQGDIYVVRDQITVLQ